MRSDHRCNNTTSEAVQSSNTMPERHLRKGVLLSILSVFLLVVLWNWKTSSSDNAAFTKPTTGDFLSSQSDPGTSPRIPPPRKYDAVFSDTAEDERTLNVHVVPHTHDDVGWLKTVEQYYHGWNNSIQHVSVDDILTTVVEALMENPHRTFTYVEQKFFGMWWDRQSEGIRDSVRQLVQDEQLTFVNGGWCMHDEAATHFMGMIDQTTLGHSFLKREFNVTPKVGWQLDPFGHSSTQASLMTYRMGFDALYFGRIDYQDLSKRHAERECEGLWNASSSWKDSSVFWGLTGSYFGNYGPPSGFCFDIHCDADYHPITGLDRKHLIRAIEDFLLQIRQQSDRTKGNHIMLTMGSDFQYQRASINFANNDLLLGTIQHLQEWNATEEIDIAAILGPHYNKVNIFYSSPDYYTQCKYKETLQARDGNKYKRLHKFGTQQSTASFRALSPRNEDFSESEDDQVLWTVKQDDFFPYSDCPNCFWTGYFTSRPALKRLERVSSSFLMAARQVDAMINCSETLDGRRCFSMMHQLEDASGVIQHHDGVSGTSKQHVAYDYTKRIQAGIDALVPCTVQKLKQTLLGEHADEYLKDMTLCQLLNETKCDVSMKASSSGDHDMYVLVYNSLAQERDTIFRLPVAHSAQYEVGVMDGSRGELSQRTSVRSHKSIFNAESENSYILPIKVDKVPPLGVKVVRIRKSLNHSDDTSGHGDLYPTTSDDKMVNVSNGYFSVGIDAENGSIRQIGSNAIHNLSIWGYYTSFDSKFDSIRDNDHQNSGAYIFRPSTPNQELQIVHAINARILNTSTGIEVHTMYEEPWIKTVTRILHGVPYIEIEYEVGPIPSNDSRGREIVTRYNTMVNNDATFYTDSNGREFVERRRNHRPTWDLTVYEPVAGNYYPVNAAMYVEDSDTAFAVVTDRTHGGASIQDGTVELMVHRRTLVDDWRGVAEPINETDTGITPCPPWGNATRIGNGLVIRGTHRIIVSGADGKERKGGAVLARAAMDEAFADPLIFVSSVFSKENVPFKATEFSGLKDSLPKNVMLITKRRLDDESALTFLVRLGHQHGLGEDPELSKPVQVDLQCLFPGQSIAHVHEVTLSGNLAISTWQDERLDWIGKRTDQSFKTDFTIGSDFTVRLECMDIRTFKIAVKT